MILRWETHPFATTGLLGAQISPQEPLVARVLIAGTIGITTYDWSSMEVRTGRVKYEQPATQQRKTSSKVRVPTRHCTRARSALSTLAQVQLAEPQAHVAALAAAWLGSRNHADLSLSTRINPVLLGCRSAWCAPLDTVSAYTTSTVYAIPAILRREV